MAYKATYFCISHIGKCRKVNQDNFICNGEFMHHQNKGTEKVLKGEVEVTSMPLFGIFDGMGGEECGEMAAYLAAEEASLLKPDGEPESMLSAYCQRANQSICKYTKEQKLTSMGTTAAMLWLHKKKIYLCNIGDSKIFQLSKRELQQISFDHVSIAVSGKKPPLTQNLGIPEEELLISPYFASGEYQKGDVYLICSDGLTDMVEEEEIARILCRDDRMASAEELLQKALDNGGKDNVSFIVLYIEKQRKLFRFGKGEKECQSKR